MRSQAVAVGLLVLIVGGSAGCAKPGSRPADDQIASVHLSVPPDTRTPLSAVPWCDDSYGHAPVYPCKWDRRERPAENWVVEIPDVAIWVYPGGCAQIARRVKVSPNDDVPFSCFYSPPAARSL